MIHVLGAMEMLMTSILAMARPCEAIFDLFGFLHMAFYFYYFFLFFFN